MVFDRYSKLYGYAMYGDSNPTVGLQLNSAVDALLRILIDIRLSFPQFISTDNALRVGVSSGGHCRVAPSSNVYNWTLPTEASEDRRPTHQPSIA